jgi:hypothetical protein
MSPYERVCEAVDRANGEDPRRVAAEGRDWPRELLYSRRMTSWVEKLAPSASEELRLAARAQHVKRWTLPRMSHPEGREGYLRWREELKKHHAGLLAGFMREAGYEEPAIAKARSLILRKQQAADPEGATLEDAACLVFLQYEFPDFFRRTEAGKMEEILRKTWGKMSENGRRAALGLELPPVEAELVRKALR